MYYYQEDVCDGQSSRNIYTQDRKTRKNRSVPAVPSTVLCADPSPAEGPMAGIPYKIGKGWPHFKDMIKSL